MTVPVAVHYKMALNTHLQDLPYVQFVEQSFPVVSDQPIHSFHVWQQQLV